MLKIYYVWERPVRITHWINVLSMMMLDVLSELPELKICVAYELDGQRIDYFPAHVDDLRKLTPVYETMPGWQQEISHMRR